MLGVNAAIFPALPIALLALSGLITTYRNILMGPYYEGKTGDLLNARTALEAALKKIGMYVNEVANGDLAKLEKSGFPISKVPTPVGPLAKAQIKNVNSISKGFEVDLEKIPSAESYLVLTTPAGAPAPADYRDWQWHFFHKTKGTIQNLNPSTNYKMVAVALGNNPSLTFSDPVERTTQA
jgi:hypothetical protein